MADADVWVEVLDARRARHLIDPSRSPETWRALDVIRWRAALAETRDHLDEALAAGGQGDPRAALVRMMAVCSAWVAAIDQETSPAGTEAGEGSVPAGEPGDAEVSLP